MYVLLLYTATQWHLTTVTGMTKHVAFNFSPLRASSGYLCQTPATMAKRNARLSINKIPVELLCEIFLKFLDDDREYPDCTPVVGPLVSFRTRADPTILGQVCSWWRNVALSTPALWAKIVILEPRTSGFYRTQLWLRRAGTHPLDLSIRDMRRNGSFDAKPLRETLSLFISRLEFWRRIDFSLPIVTLDLLASIKIKSNAHLNLQSASIRISLSSRIERSRSPIDAMWRVLHSSPMLHEVNWWDSYRGELPGHAPWGQLTKMSLQFEFTVKTLLDVLALCPQLEEVDIFRLSISQSSKQYNKQEPLILENLHSLTLEAEVDTGPLFRSLILPSLRSLNLRHDLSDEIVRDLGAFHRCLANSNCSLKVFSLSDWTLGESDLVTYLSTPFLRNILFFKVQGPLSDQAVGFFTRLDTHGQPEVMPYLEEMNLTVRTTRDGLLSRMVSSRWSADANRLQHKSLKKMILHQPEGYGDYDDQALTTMFNTGLKGWKS